MQAIKKSVTIQVIGMVQGVGFRYDTVHKAQELGLVGWVRNEEGGSVKIVAEGEEENLQKLIEWCRKGTGFSKVDDVKVEWQEANGEFSNFEIK